LHAAYLFPLLLLSFLTAVDDAAVLLMIGNVAVCCLPLVDLLLF